MIEFSEVKKLLAAPNPAENRQWQVPTLAIAKIGRASCRERV